MTSPRRRGLRLGGKLGVGLAIVAAVTAALLLLWVGPRTKAMFLDGSGRLITESSNVMRAMARERTEQSTELLVDLIQYTTDARHRLLADLPLSLYAGGGDLERLRQELQTRDAARAEQLRANVGILAREMERRAVRRIEAELERLEVEQAALGEALAGEMRVTSLLLAGLALAASIALIGVGLYRVVVRPLRELRTAARSVAGGDLAVEVAVASRDEVGDLAADFATMVGRLRASRDEIGRKNAELRDWNETLEREVARKTEHLRRAQRRLVHAAKMASVGTLAGGVAHEFNNVIGGIRGCAVEALEDERDPDRREVLEVIVRAAGRGVDITDQLLRFARQRVHAVGPVDVARVLDESLRLVEARARKAGVTVERSGAERLPACADASALHQVFLNLATNAIQAMPDGGVLHVSAGLDGDEVMVCIRDTGTGIAADQLEHVFEPFWTSRDREADPARRGTGLGLSVSYGLIEAHGGSIDVASEPDVGSTFTVRIPEQGPTSDEDGSDDSERSRIDD